MTYYDQIAKGYNRLHGEEQIKKAKIVLQHIKPKPDDFLLDIGCGTGISTELFKCNKLGIDPAKELLKQAKFPTINTGAESLPLKDNTFDTIISLTAIHNFKDIKRGIKEMLRVGKQSCKYGVSVLKKSSKAKTIDTLIKKNFKIIKTIDEGKDTIYILKKK